MNANLTTLTNNAKRPALRPSSLVGKCGTAMPAGFAVAGLVWGTDAITASGKAASNTQIRGTQSYRSAVRTNSGSDILGTERKISIRRCSKPRVANA